jgi:hypothetical protein
MEQSLWLKPRNATRPSLKSPAREGSRLLEDSQLVI